MRILAPTLLSLGLLLGSVGAHALSVQAQPAATCDNDRDRQERWQRLPPEKRDKLMRRYEEFQRLPPEEREVIQQRYQEFRKLPPEERRAMKQRWQDQREPSHEEGDRPRRGKKHDRPSDRDSD